MMHYLFDSWTGSESRYSASTQPEKFVATTPGYGGVPGYPPMYKPPSTESLSSDPLVSSCIKIVKMHVRSNHNEREIL